MVLVQVLLGSTTSFLNTTPKFPEDYPLWVGFPPVITCLFHLVQSPAETFTHHGPITTLSHVQHEHAQHDAMQPDSLQLGSRAIVLRYSFCQSSMSNSGHRPFTLIHPILGQSNGKGLGEDTPTSAPNVTTCAAYVSYFIISLFAETILCCKTVELLQYDSDFPACACIQTLAHNVCKR